MGGERNITSCDLSLIGDGRIKFRVLDRNKVNSDLLEDSGVTNVSIKAEMILGSQSRKILGFTRYETVEKDVGLGTISVQFSIEMSNALKKDLEQTLSHGKFIVEHFA